MEKLLHNWARPTPAWPENGTSHLLDPRSMTGTRPRTLPYKQTGTRHGRANVSKNGDRKPPRFGCAFSEDFDRFWCFLGRRQRSLATFLGFLAFFGMGCAGFPRRHLYLVSGRRKTPLYERGHGGRANFSRPQKSGKSLYPGVDLDFRTLFVGILVPNLPRVAVRRGGRRCASRGAAAGADRTPMLGFLRGARACRAPCFDPLRASAYLFRSSVLPDGRIDNPRLTKRPTTPSSEETNCSLLPHKKHNPKTPIDKANKHQTFLRARPRHVWPRCVTTYNTAVLRLITTCETYEPAYSTYTDHYLISIDPPMGSDSQI